ncbi:DUF881 domain-containing protein [Clostridium chauvoei]|uniref:Division initiation protein n=2 Tax=Clostridium chauvoei TaxID=46867 RepID=A0A1U6JEC1_9CLOT|nr:DUF881 domain-containing protein [Clostridium chauvoei]ATD55221.1 division initiation protein [Clostridium chauvoei]ATD57107.1 division initiation protein [Clostridium chauvoei]MBX7279565.1 DUF881 domain-containing protein [Clostridium chauvoei]MBX7281934.1 DUF881 domain-containing protein [Clostridium chauvoei]MBX7284477.1 DUF881 domain-containing protein [Clostridium chauvoei]
MKRATGKILIFFGSILLGFFIINGISLKNMPRMVQLNAIEYKKAIDERNQLYKEVEGLREENYKNKEKMNSYNHDDKRQEKVFEDMKNQVKDYGMITGLSDVKGPGVVLKITDGDINLKQDTQFETWRKILHDSDMALVLNEARKAGGEAIAVNNHRVIPLTGVVCNWAFIGFDDDSMEYAPFYIYIIGDPEQLKTALLSEDSHIQKLILRELKVEIEIKDEITIPGTIQNLESKYMERHEGN